MAVNGIELQVGQTWRKRGGATACVREALDRDDYPWQMDDGEMVTDQGRDWTTGEESEDDLVELISGPPTFANGSPAGFVTAAEARDLAGLALPPTTAPDLLAQAGKHMADRAATYDKPEGERSMAATVTAFNAQTGRNLTESEGWLFMVNLKIVRDRQRAVAHRDSCEDLVAYGSLYGEARLQEGGV